ncbi:putative aminodeoxychorismate lyase [compost metagenome]
MNDILPPNRQRPRAPETPVNPPAAPQPQAPTPRPLQLTDALEPNPAGPLVITPKQSMSLGKRIVLIVTAILMLLVVAAVAAFFWYQHETSPVSSDPNATRVRVTIESGTTPDEIGLLLSEKKVIRNTTAFEVYTRISGTRNKLQAGTFSLSPHESTAAIVDHLVAGKTDQFSITFLPGATVTENKKVFLAAGYSQSEVDAAFRKTYDSPLFQDKPVVADLEGYIYGETYTFSAGSTVEQILQRTFDEFYTVIDKNNLVAGLKTQGLNLYQGITLASIIQREVAMPKGSEPSLDQKQVAQIFLKRLSIGMMLGSDVTYQYAADKEGVERDTNLDSPYNTRRYTGLPPGPIATPGVTALMAVASPAPGDYLFFLSGDDDVTYFGRTEAEHQSNIENHCAKKCLLL